MASRTLMSLAAAAGMAAGLGGGLSGCDEPDAPATQETPQRTAPATPEKPAESPAKPKEGEGAKPKAEEKKSEAKFEKVTIKGKTFNLELALDDEHRFRGLSGREEIPADGGMLFVFQRPSVHGFVMRDCPVPIDIIYLDGSGRVVSFHKMTPEEPRSEEEKRLSPPFRGAPEWAHVNQAYEDRLKRYSSRFDSQFVIELKGNTLDSLDLKTGDKIELDTQRLKKQAK